jgi:DNA-binding winged helix-turn-helix (wHTH) protein/TolB-like protein/tetratricopeptide (TPR) repeat protein
MVGADAYEFGGFVLQPLQRRLLRGDGTPVELSPRLFNALAYFVERPDELLYKEALMKALWPGLVVEENNLSQVVAGLRRALGDDAQGSRFIQTVPRQGFRFVAKVERPTSAAPMEVAVPELSAAGSGRRHQVILALGAATAAALGGAGWWAWSRPPPFRSAATLAVLPFKPIEAESQDKLLEIGMADSLIARLSTVPGLVVRSTGTVRPYAGAAQDPLRAARELEVAWILDGTLQRRGDKLRTSARLLRAADGVAAWSGHFDENFTDVFDVQDQISSKVVQALLPVLRAGLGAHPRVSEIGGTRNPNAYQLYLAARWRAQGGRSAEIDKGLALLNQAISLDPAYAMAWVELSQVHRRKLWNSDGLASEVFEPANAALQHSLAIVPDLAEAEAGLAFSRFWFEFDWVGAERSFRRALKLNPDVATAHWGLALLILSQDRLAEEGFVHLRTARSLDPMSPVYHTVEAGLLLAAGRRDEARMRLNRSLDIAPDLWLTSMAMGLLHMAEQRSEQGIAELRRAVTLSDASRARSVLGVQLAHLGETGETRWILNQLLDESKRRFVTPTSIASLHAALGEVGPALTALEQAFRAKETRVAFLKDDPHWTGLRAEPRFAALVKSLKLDRYGPGLSPV